ncbi:hypothetical protein [Enterococcus pallens]|uniref:Uncharacterized protein n=1 Tax=Enterococcus pallens ATCC BAA-351 TaxID=1158607 RepID=R2RTG8_9ENTE|nr:hypothetical protein [Enterococcus pallens]EOH86615.1 hypothetical protein UAU_05056 [Enterococcus pallens ATCC BAA-351]EOU18411.1 hypothetical protein I588_03401 [Enterococcus pallens ATCC BAA-351]OJG81277.1 hypothetical protein RV10_GL003405 [Enterococcus pallens]
MERAKRIKEMVTEAAEHVYDLLKDNQVEVTLDTKEKKGLKVRKMRPTQHTIKWKAKNH